MTDATSIPHPALSTGLVGRLDHVAIAVHDLRAAVNLFHDVLGGEYVAGGDDPVLGIRTVQFRFPAGSKIELMTPVHDEASLHDFLDHHGEGFHHVTLFVDDLDLAIERLERDDYQVVGIERTRPDWHEAYVRPRSGFGTLLQLVQTTVDWANYATDLTLAQVLDGDVVWIESTPVAKSRAPTP